MNIRDFHSQRKAAPNGLLKETQPNSVPKLKVRQADVLVGTVLGGKYELLELVGRGGMGSLYKAKHVALGRIMAIKMLHADLIQDDTQMERFAREARATASLTHVNVAAVHDIGTDDQGRPYLVMEFLQGLSLSQIIKKAKTVPWNQALEIAVQVARGLSYAHSKDLLHRDLKPSNVMLVGEPDAVVVKIVDFGISKSIQGHATQSLTKTGEVIGSPLYMSPEQCQGLKLDERSDIYSFGCMLFELLSGQPPLMGDTSVATIFKQIGETPPHFTQIVPQLRIPEVLENIVLKCLEKAPENRFRTANELTAALESLQRKMIVAETNIDAETHIAAAANSPQGTTSVEPARDSAPDASVAPNAKTKNMPGGLDAQSPKRQGYTQLWEQSLANEPTQVTPASPGAYTQLWEQRLANDFAGSNSDDSALVNVNALTGKHGVVRKVKPGHLLALAGLLIGGMLVLLVAAGLSSIQSEAPKSSIRAIPGTNPSPVAVYGADDVEPFKWHDPAALGQSPEVIVCYTDGTTIQPSRLDGFYISNSYYKYPGAAEVHISSKHKNVILVLCGYMPIKWTINADPGVKIDRVVVSGHCKQTVKGIPSGVPVAETSENIQSPTGANLVSETRTNLPFPPFELGFFVDGDDPTMDPRFTDMRNVLRSLIGTDKINTFVAYAQTHYFDPDNLTKAEVAAEAEAAEGK